MNIKSDKKVIAKIKSLTNIKTDALIYEEIQNYLNAMIDLMCRQYKDVSKFLQQNENITLAKLLNSAISEYLENNVRKEFR